MFVGLDYSSENSNYFFYDKKPLDMERISRKVCRSTSRSNLALLSRRFRLQTFLIMLDEKEIVSAPKHGLDTSMSHTETAEELLEILTCYAEPDEIRETLDLFTCAFLRLDETYFKEGRQEREDIAQSLTALHAALSLAQKWCNSPQIMDMKSNLQT